MVMNGRFTFNMFDIQAWYARDVVMGRITLSPVQDLENEYNALRAKEDCLEGDEVQKFKHKLQIWQIDKIHAHIDLWPLLCTLMSSTPYVPKRTASRVTTFKHKLQIWLKKNWQSICTYTSNDLFWSGEYPISGRVHAGKTADIYRTFNLMSECWIWNESSRLY